MPPLAGAPLCVPPMSRPTLSKWSRGLPALQLGLPRGCWHSGEASQEQMAHWLCRTAVLHLRNSCVKCGSHSLIRCSLQAQGDCFGSIMPSVCELCAHTM